MAVGVMVGPTISLARPGAGFPRGEASLRLPLPRRLERVVGLSSASLVVVGPERKASFDWFAGEPKRDGGTRNHLCTCAR